MSADARHSDVAAPFWAGVRERKLMLQFDAASGRAQFYPRPQSLHSEAGVVWREASGRGTIYALTNSRVAPTALAGRVPYALALVKLEEGPRMLARVLAPFDQLAIGQAVRITWEEGGDAPAFPAFRPTGVAGGFSQDEGDSP
ncbi:MAG: Zn-ribbon domain-containing OB-fold protein [Hydrogenophaga sp.]|uniref:Zn-ribbon domain-containing OB-fold protein n=1 Tax=Hydrogenophaga sp. TaxID=1904254 RepID=UPI003D10749D